MELFGDAYHVYRHDRNSENPSVRGGGVLVAIHSNFSSSCVLLPTNNIEAVYTSVYVNNNHIIFGSIYIPPASDITTYSNLLHDIEKLTDRYPDAKLCLVGDFNLPGIEWSREDDQLIGIPSNSLETFVCDNLAYHGLLQHNFNVNMNNTTLDLVLVNSDNVKVYAI
ncbi:Endonuclease-reverse transcriptase [Popillia japonica]|uniref:Endonuclease-reverse transcriptase n=1 Tax=Popillia japonica TaxID=7064 RepID=A0AAW1N3V1_POPJA